MYARAVCTVKIWETSKQIGDLAACVWASVCARHCARLRGKAVRATERMRSFYSLGPSSSRAFLRIVTCEYSERFSCSSEVAHIIFGFLELRFLSFFCAPYALSCENASIAARAGQSDPDARSTIFKVSCYVCSRQAASAVPGCAAPPCSMSSGVVMMMLGRVVVGVASGATTVEWESCGEGRLAW
eukprot:6186804-Pleurochrysis_carterae.AAC.1